MRTDEQPCLTMAILYRQALPPCHSQVTNGHPPEDRLSDVGDVELGKQYSYLNLWKLVLDMPQYSELQ